MKTGVSNPQQHKASPLSASHKRSRKEKLELALQ